MTATLVNDAGRLLAERLGLSIVGREGDDLKCACVACESSDGMRINEQRGVAHCYVCKAGWSPYGLAEKQIGKAAAVALMVELGIFEERGEHTANGHHAAQILDPLESLAKEKGVTPEALKVYGATAERGAVTLPMYDPDGVRCSTFTMRPGNGKGKNARGKPSGVFLPEGRRPQADETWLVVEGPKDAAAGKDLGFNAIGLPTSELSPKFAALLDDCNVVIVPDLDTAGQNGAQKTARRLWGHAKSIRIARLPGEIAGKKGEDLRDVLKRPGGRDLTLKAIDEAKPWHPLSDDEIADSSIDSLLRPEGRTDSANARRLAALYGEIIRYCDPWSSFLVFDGKRWAIDKTRSIDALAKKLGGKIWVLTSEVLPRVSNPRLVNELLAFAKATNNANGIRNMVALMRSESDIPILPEQLDQDAWALNVLNGTFDLRTQKLRSHRREDYLTRLCPVAYDPKADCPLWCNFLREISGDNPRLVGFLRRMVGFSLTGTTVEHVLLFLYGTGSNGKSTFLNTMLALFGPDYAMQAPHDFLVAKKGQSHPTELTDLHGKRFVACIETEDGRRLAESLVKQLTGGDKIRARRMREDLWEFTATHKIWLAGNHKLNIRGTDHGVWRRIKLVPFTVTIPDNQQDKNLPNKLLAELPGILNWALLGCAEWQADGLGEPDEVKDAIEQYRGEMDLLGQFIDERCGLGPQNRDRAAELYAAYRKWAEDGGEHPVSQRVFGTALGERGFQRYTNNGTWYRGIELLSGTTEPRGSGF